MKIIHILNHFLPDHVAGTEIYTYSLCKNLEISAFEAIGVIPNYGQTINEEYFYEGLRVIKYAEPSVVDRELQMGKRKPDGLKNFIEVLKKELPDVVHFHELAGSNGITLHHVMAAKKLGFRIIMTFHLGRYTATSDTLYSPVDVFNIKEGSYNFYRNKGFGNRTAKIFFPVANLFRNMGIDISRLGKIGTAISVPQLVEEKKKNFCLLIENCDRVVTIARWYHDLLLKNGVDSNKLFFIEQGIDYVDDSSNQSRNSDSIIKVIFVGRISHFKGVKMLIESVSELDSDKLQLDIYGDSGEDKRYIEDCMEIASTKTNIRFMGRLKPGESIRKMSEYDVLVLPSTFSEMSPLVIRESFAAGTPVMASDSLGSKEQIKDGLNGWLFKMNDPEDLSKKLKMLIDHPELLKEASKYLPPIRTFQDVAMEYEKIYKEVAV